MCVCYFENNNYVTITIWFSRVAERTFPRLLNRLYYYFFAATRKNYWPLMLLGDHRCRAFFRLKLWKEYTVFIIIFTRISWFVISVFRFSIGLCPLRPIRDRLDKYTRRQINWNESRVIFENIHLIRRCGVMRIECGI